MKFKKLLCVLAATAAAATPVLVGCSKENDAQTVKVYMPDGAPAIALASLMDSGYDNTEFTVVSSTVIAQYVSNGEADMAVLPINAAATLYNKGVGIVMLSVNTHGNLYVVGDGEDITLEGFTGKRVGVIGQGNVPDLTLRMMLGESGIDYEISDTAKDGSVSISYAADGAALLPLLKKGDIDYAFLAEPAATTACNNLEKSILMDVQEQWQEIFGGEYPQACLVAKSSLIESDPEYIENFLTALENSDSWAEEHPSETVATIADHMITGTESTLTTLTSDIVKRCNIETVRARDQKSECNTYFEKLTQLMTELGTPVLSAVPDEGFYY